MKCKLITTATNLEHPGFLLFKKGLDKFNWDYEVLGGVYKGYGTKMCNALDYAKKTDCTHLFIADAYDMMVLSDMDEVIESIEFWYGKDCILFNAEKACWPHPEWAKEYPETESQWKYLNGGLCFVEIQRFIKMLEENPIKSHENDQEILGRVFLDKRHLYDMKLDNTCEVFQSVAFEHENDFNVFETLPNSYLRNTQTGSFPSFLHANGGGGLEKYKNLL